MARVQVHCMGGNSCHIRLQAWYSEELKQRSMPRPRQHGVDGSGVYCARTAPLLAGAMRAACGAAASGGRMRQCAGPIAAW